MSHEPPTATAASAVPPALFKTLTFGQWITGIDWMWVQNLTDPALSRVHKGEHPTVYFRFMTAAELDPAFFYLYYAGANLLAIVRDDGLGARDLLTRAEDFRRNVLPGMPSEFREKHWGRSWQVPLMLAYVHLFELNDIRSAAASFIQASEIRGAPVYLTSLAHRFEKPGGEYEVGLRLLNFMISSERDPVAKERLESKRQSLFIGQFLFHLRAAFGRYLQDEPSYRATVRPAYAEMLRYWERFLKSTRSPDCDPLGGKLSLDSAGRVVTSTPHQAVFGLE